ncbi:Formamidopyrimidine-DNA glycosylase N-terminal domain-containing protein [Lasiosphaeris hirsuta]|uniref:Formamidopyrimidine-DNA glycosylase N-terminal domain-containing protein n=1 Tax=Lasiosphaeris hirsuta TaxID=260670 RepID=A0AA40A1H3_9PEZI|nr:Formamidopyrimidine-DNA glycosylase N-terminal domain-containing protein [Lasiosphaeris hirsuta]
MPEIAEIARIVHYLRLHLVGKTIKTASAIEDTNVFGKVGTTGVEVAEALNGKKVVSAGNQGKYFWIVLSKPPHLVMHFGMTGWIHIKGERTAYTNYYNKLKADEADAWPPKYWKFQLKTDDAVELAFTDPRRFSRVRLVNCDGKSIRQNTPLVENGPDPVVDTDVFTKAFLSQKMRSRHVPIKALLLDQAVISGIGNWVGDEVLFQAKLHPEQYCNEFSDEQITKLYGAILYVCQLAVDKLGDSDQFPKDWVFHYRWGKGTKGPGHLPSGEKLAFLTVGGRTSCYAPGLQKKTGSVVSGVKEEVADSDQEVSKPKKPSKSKATAKKAESNAEPKMKQPQKRKIKVEDSEDEKPAKKGKAVQAKPSAHTNGTAADLKISQDAEGDGGKRRSGRLRKKPN